ncbi:unnamed protein product [Hapterophycus canaliculatus]
MLTSYEVAGVRRPPTLHVSTACRDAEKGSKMLGTASWRIWPGCRGRPFCPTNMAIMATGWRIENVGSVSGLIRSTTSFPVCPNLFACQPNPSQYIASIHGVFNSRPIGRYRVCYLKGGKQFCNAL